MKLDKGTPITFRNGIHGTIFGGPFREYIPNQRRLVSVKMAEEVDHPHDFKVDTPDFGVPSPEDMKAGILFGIEAMSKGSDVYVGCFGGIGRTGLYMGCMAKIMLDYLVETDGLPAVSVDPVKYVRRHYISHAIETQAQQDYVRSFDSSDALQWLRNYDRRKVETKVVTREVVRTVTEYVDRVEYLGPIDWVIHKIFGR